MWSKLSDSAKTITTIISLVVMLSGAISTFYVWYNSVSDIVDNYPKLKERIELLEQKCDTSKSVVSRERYDKENSATIKTLWDLYNGKYPYMKYAKQGIDY